MFKILAAFILIFSVTAKAQQPVIKGGVATFFKNNTVYPPYALHNCIQGTVTVGFKLTKNGQVFNAAITKGLGADLDAEALRLLRLSSKNWVLPLNYDTTVTVIVPINFTLKDYNCEQRNKKDIALALASYKLDEELTNLVLNFYRNKEKGIYKPEDEPKINGFKAQLGITDEYLEQKIKDGLKKQRQGDFVGACQDFNFVKYMGSGKADELLAKYCK